MEDTTQEQFKKQEQIKRVETAVSGDFETAEVVAEKTIKEIDNEVGVFDGEGRHAIDGANRSIDLDAMTLEGIKHETQVEQRTNELAVEARQLGEEEKKEIRELEKESAAPSAPEGFAVVGKIPPPLPQEARFIIPPPLPQEAHTATPPPLPQEGYAPLQETGNERVVEKDSVEWYLQESKIGDKEEALRRIMAYVGATSEEDLRNKLNEKDEEGDPVIRILSPNTLYRQNNPSLNLLRKIRGGAYALGYTFSNTSDYELAVGDVIGNMLDKGRIEDAREVERIFKEDRDEFETEKEKSVFKEIDPMFFEMNEIAQKEYIGKIKNLPPDAIVQLYHGFNSSQYEAAQGILDSSAHGVEQHSGPTLSLVPVGTFWKKGGLGLRYNLRRAQIAFPGEENPHAVVRMQKNSFGDEGDGIITHESGSLSLAQFDGEVMRSVGTFPNFEAEKKLQETLNSLAEKRNGSSLGQQ